MMTPALSALASKLAAPPRWRWLPGTLAVDAADPRFRIRLHAADEGAVVRTPRGTSVYVDDTVPETAPRLPPGHEWIPDLSDPVTAAALLVLAREVSGCPEAVACCWRDLAWAVWPYSEAYAAWCEHGGDAYVLSGMSGLTWTEHASEIEALAAVILRGGE